MKHAAPFQFQKSPPRSPTLKRQKTMHEKSVNEINQALDFAGLCAGLQLQEKLTNPLLSANIGMDFDFIALDKNRRATSPVLFTSQVVGREIISKNNGITRFVDLIRLAEDKHKRGYFSTRSSQISKISHVSKLVSFYDQDSIDDTELTKPWQQSAQKRMDRQDRNDRMDSPPDFTPTWRKSSQSPPRESEKKSSVYFADSPEAHLAQSRGLKIDTSTTSRGYTQAMNVGSTGLHNGVNYINSSRMSTVKSSPYFQHNFRPDARSQSPTSSTTRKLDFINLVESEILTHSKNKLGNASILKMQSSTKNLTSSQTSQPSQAGSASIKSPTSGLTTSSLWMRTSQKSPTRTKAIIVDAEKRYRMSNSPKPEARPVHRNEAENLKKSLKMLNNMIS